MLVKQVIPDTRPSAAEASTVLGITPNTVATSKRTNATKKNKKHDFHADDVNQPIKSSHTLRMQWDGMPEDGWVVDATTRACQCRFHSKYNLCPHIIEAIMLVNLPCPGLNPPVRRFHSRDKRQRSSAVRPSSATTYRHLPNLSFAAVPASIRCPAVPDVEEVHVQPMRASASYSTRTERPSSAPSRTLYRDVPVLDNSHAPYTTSLNLTLRESCEHTKHRRFNDVYAIDNA